MGTRNKGGPKVSKGGDQSGLSMTNVHLGADEKPAVPPTRDERKVFLVCTYKLQGKKMQMMNFHGRLNSGYRDFPIDTFDEAKKVAQEALSRSTRGHYDLPTGVAIFESVAIIKPKPIEIELEEMQLITK